MGRRRNPDGGPSAPSRTRPVDVRRRSLGPDGWRADATSPSAPRALGIRGLQAARCPLCENTYRRSAYAGAVECKCPRHRRATPGGASAERRRPRIAHLASSSRPMPATGTQPCGGRRGRSTPGQRNSRDSALEAPTRSAATDIVVKHRESDSCPRPSGRGRARPSRSASRLESAGLGRLGAQSRVTSPASSPRSLEHTVRGTPRRTGTRSRTTAGWSRRRTSTPRRWNWSRTRPASTRPLNERGAALRSRSR